MGSLSSRLARLEARARATSPPADEVGNRDLFLYCKAVENYRREVVEGLPPIALTPEEQEWERESDEEFLRKGLPAMRADPGWQSTESQRLLDSWEQDIRKNLEERS